MFDKVWVALDNLKIDQHKEIMGICGLILRLMRKGDLSEKAKNEWFDRRNDAFSSWSKFSGNIAYPVTVECDNNKLSWWNGSPSTIEKHLYENCPCLWDTNAEYGRNRWDLLNHCITYFKDLDL